MESMEFGCYIISTHKKKLRYHLFIEVKALNIQSTPEIAFKIG